MTYVKHPMLLLVMLVAALFVLLTGSFRTADGTIDMTDTPLHRLAKSLHLGVLLTLFILAATWLLPATIQLGQKTYADGHSLDQDEITSHDLEDAQPADHRTQHRVSTTKTAASS